MCLRFVRTLKWSSTCIYPRPPCLRSSSLSSRPLARLPAVAWKSVYILTSGCFSFHGVLLKETPTREIFPHHCISSPKFWGNLLIVFHSGCTSLIPPTVHTISTSLLALAISLITILTDVRCYHLPVILTCISLVINDIEYFFGTYWWFTYLFGKSVYVFAHLKTEFINLYEFYIWDINPLQMFSPHYVGSFHFHHFFCFAEASTF